MAAKKIPKKKKAKKQIDVIGSMESVTEEVRLGTLPRRRIRNILFRIRDNRVYNDDIVSRAPGLQAIFESQFHKVQFGPQEISMEWSNFTVVWDVHPTHHLQIVTAQGWQHAGGEKDENGDHKPTAFTKQG